MQTSFKDGLQHRDSSKFSPRFYSFPYISKNLHIKYLKTQLHTYYCVLPHFSDYCIYI